MSLERQLAMNRRSWQALREHGVTEQTKLRVDFFYIAPGELEAKRLMRFLQLETDYDVRATSSQGAWAVDGSTQETELSLAILDEWVEWMVAAGQHCGCDFDGWGAAVP